MRTWRLALAGLMTAGLVGAQAGTGMGADPVAEPGEPATFMFVGNSLTYWGDGVPQEFERIVESDTLAAEPTITTVGFGGTILRSFLDMTAFRLTQRDYDVVVLQDDPPEYQGRDLALFMETARLFDEAIADESIRTVYYMTWPYAPLDWVSLEDIVALHREAEAELGVSIAPVGLVFARVEAEFPELLTLTGDDGGHPSRLGTYLAAATIYATIFDRSPDGLYYPEYVMTEDVAADLHRIVWETVEGWQAEGAE